jgi:cell division transport system permease protein
MLISLLRTIKFSFQDISRNIWLSLVTIIILILALFSINMLLVVKVIGEAAVGAVKEKIDISIYIKSTAEESEIMELKAKLASLDEVRDVIYISKVEALENFKKKRENDPEILQALRELGKNPLSPSLVVKPRNTDEFNNLINYINSADDSIIESRDFSDYEMMLGKINSITDKVSEAGLFLSGIFVLITLLVIYNSVKVAIYTHRLEIIIMRLVGASNWFIQMPYLLSSAIYTFVGVGAIMLIFYPFLSLLQPYLETFFVDYNVNLVTYFYGNALYIFGLQFIGAVFINMLASLLAVRKYSKV